MNYMAKNVHQNIVVVPVLDFKEVLEQTVASEGLDEVSNSCLPVATKYLLVYVPQTALVGDLLQVADSPSVVNELN